MSNPCLSCKYAAWTRTVNGRLHPDGAGRCMWKMPEIQFPKAFYYVGWSDKRQIPQPSGGHIDRKGDERECPTYEVQP